ncbi:MAG: MBL fold metallo-hydrolase [Dehalococcoidia bacterium]|nr:MBL fold metallo-hydrolase [Dehalococcoidia bacterium]
MKLTPNIYCYIWQGMGNNCNTYLFVGDTITLIDPGHIKNERQEPCLERLLGAMAKDGFKAEDVGLIILTHAHPDHCESASVINAGSAKIAVHRDKDGYAKMILEQMSRLFGLKPVEITPDSFLEDGDILHLGGIELNVIYTPGHSSDSISLYCEKEKTLITGDVIFSGSIGRTDFPGGSIDILKQSIERLSKLDVEYLLPGHMDIVSSKSNVQNNFTMVKRMFFGIS